MTVLKKRIFVLDEHCKVIVGRNRVTYGHYRKYNRGKKFGFFSRTWWKTLP